MACRRAFAQNTVTACTAFEIQLSRSRKLASDKTGPPAAVTWRVSSPDIADGAPDIQLAFGRTWWRGPAARSSWPSSARKADTSATLTAEPDVTPRPENIRQRSCEIFIRQMPDTRHDAVVFNAVDRDRSGQSKHSCGQYPLAVALQEIGPGQRRKRAC